MKLFHQKKMKNYQLRTVVCVILALAWCFGRIFSCAPAFALDEPLIIDHTSVAEFENIPDEYIEAAKKEHNIKGVIFAVPYNCDKHYWDVIWLQRDLLEKQIPSLILQPEGYMKSEAIRTRVAAFLEMIA